MELSVRINQVIASMEALKIQSADASARSNSQFASIWKTAVDGKQDTVSIAVAQPYSAQVEAAPEIPSWVDPDYGYDPANPRKPKMRELMEAMSGRSVETLYADPNSNWQDASHRASEILYGVLGSNEDFRDWNAIMASSDIVKAARQATGEMYAPTVDILSIGDNLGCVTEQHAAIYDENGNILRSLAGRVSYVRETLQNFGATSASIPQNLRSRVYVKGFDQSILEMLAEYKSPYEISSKVNSQIL